MRIAFFGVHGKVGAALVPALEAAGHEVVDAAAGVPESAHAGIDFTRPDAVLGNVERCLGVGAPVVIGTTGFDRDAVDESARNAGVCCWPKARSTSSSSSGSPIWAARARTFQVLGDGGNP